MKTNRKVKKQKKRERLGSGKMKGRHLGTGVGGETSGTNAAATGADDEQIEVKFGVSVFVRLIGFRVD